jgi:ribosome-associated toxin RatA of RatAB toxin-antitoxin module
MTKIKKEATIEAPVTQVYAAWRNFENFPYFMKNIEEVSSTSDTMSHWKAKGPLGMNAEWDAEITLDEPNEAIGWRGIQGASPVINSGRVNFKEDGANRTCLDVTIEYAAPGGIVGDLAAKIFSNPEKQVEEDLARFRDCIAGGVVVGSGRFNAASLPGESKLGRSIEDGIKAKQIQGDDAGDQPLGSSMGAVTENDLAEASKIGDNGNVPPATSDPLAIGVGEEGSATPSPRSDPSVLADSRQAGL